MYTHVHTIISIIFTITIDIIRGGKDCNIMTFPRALALIFFANMRNIYSRVCYIFTILLHTIYYIYPCLYSKMVVYIVFIHI